jgi:hypothetical protein
MNELASTPHGAAGDALLIGGMLATSFLLPLLFIGIIEYFRKRKTAHENNCR